MINPDESRRNPYRLTEICYCLGMPLQTAFDCSPGVLMLSIIRHQAKKLVKICNSVFQATYLV